MSPHLEYDLVWWCIEAADEPEWNREFWNHENVDAVRRMVWSYLQ